VRIVAFNTAQGQGFSEYDEVTTSVQQFLETAVRAR